MGQKLIKYYEDIKRIGGLTAQIRLAVITKITGTKAGTAGDYAIDGSKSRDFECEQIKGIECGDDYAEFIVRPAKGENYV